LEYKYVEDNTSLVTKDWKGTYPEITLVFPSRGSERLEGLTEFPLNSYFAVRSHALAPIAKGARCYHLYFAQNFILTGRDDDFAIFGGYCKKDKGLALSYRIEEFVAFRMGVVCDINMHQYGLCRSSICFFCNEKRSISIDRKDLTHGFTPDNIISICRKCRLTRHSKRDREFKILSDRIQTQQKSRRDTLRKRKRE